MSEQGPVVAWVVDDTGFVKNVSGGEDGSIMAGPEGATAPALKGGERGTRTVIPEGEFSGRLRVALKRQGFLSPRPS